MNNSGHWRMGASASAVALLVGLASFDATALGLGRITVQSALGEPLRAEIDISEINADEANSLRAGVASPDAFKQAGLEYTPAVVGLQVSLQKRADGRAFLRLSSSRPVTEPFVDLVLEANWSSGRIVRDYTMLFDPPNLRQAASPVSPTAPIFSRPAPPAPVPPPPATGIASIPYYPTSPPPVRVTPAPATPVQRPAPVPRTPAVARVPASGQQVTVKAGDTAGKIAAQNKPASISLDQMLVALLRSNPDAFIGGNINRLKSGAVLDLPSADDAGAVAPGEASRTIVAQSKDFNDFRRKLADGVPATTVDSSSRQASGKVQARVEDKAPATAAPDKLTLSKGAVQGKTAAEEKIAKERESKAASDRVAELSKNISDLSKLTGAPAATASAPKGVSLPVANPGNPASSPIATGSAASAPASAPRPVASAAIAAASAPAPASLPAASSPIASASVPASPASGTAAVAAVSSPPVAPVVKKPVAPPPPPPPEPSLMEELQDNPFVLPGIAALLLLLAGFGFYRYKKRSSAVQVDSSFLESRLQPDSFFGASGGQRIDTSEGGATGSSLVYSPSQLDAAGDVDPVAEADVYLAYGRDLQAEEILKEAMRTTPTRVAIHSKLMEIYAKRRDAKAFEVVAIEAFNLTRGDGPEWAYIAEMGRDLDASNPLYQPGGQPHMAERRGADSNSDAPAFGSSTIPQMIEAQPEEPAGSVDFDLDLDFSLGDEPPAVAALPAAAAPVAPAPSYQPEPTVAMQALPADPIFDGLEMDFSTGTVVLKPTAEPAPISLAEDHPADMALSASGLTFTTEEPAPAPAKAAPAPAPLAAEPDSGMLEFDLGSLSLDLGGPSTESPTLSPAEAADGGDDPLATKLALAEEFQALGDSDGARALAEEVASQSSGPLKSKAQAFLNGLS
ncbi:MAG: FimV/HubP family polar landmark protein [Pseudomonadota bacterium]